MFMMCIKQVLADYQQDAFLEDYVNLLYSLYINNFKARFSQESQNMVEETKSILHFANSKMADEHAARQMVSDLVKVCDENKYIQRNCAGKIFSSTIAIDTLKNYADSKKRIFVDTTLPLHMLCFFNYQVKDVKNYYYVLSCSMYEFCKKRHIQLYLTRAYFNEVVHHVWEAINLIPYSKIPGIEKLGGSKNVFYNFYHYLKKLGKDNGMTYSEFLDEMKFQKYPMEGTLEQQIEFQLRHLGMNIVEFTKKYDIDNTRKLLDNELTATGKINLSLVLMMMLLCFVI